jgi:Tfp pilus assembly protein PilF
MMFASSAPASEQSKRLYSRGLVEFHAGRLQEALALFDSAVNADDRDALAYYYRAVTRGRLKDQDGAIADLEQALKYKPDLHEAGLDLGVALIEAGRFRDAILPLERARNSADLDGQASLYLGIAWLRLDEYAKARSYFEHARTAEADLEPTARYYLGVIDFKQSRFDSARIQFKYAISTRPGSRVAAEAQTFLAQIDKASAERFELWGAVGFQYDSNVVLAPASDLAASSLGVTKQDDGRVTLNAGGNYLLGRSDWGRIVVGYEFYQSLHFELNEFNLEDHRANVTFSARGGPFQWGVIGRYDYYLLKTDDFLREGTVIPYLTWPQRDIGWTEVSAQVRRRDFLIPDFQIRDAINYAPSITQLLFLRGRRDRYVTFGYMWDYDDTDRQSRSRPPSAASDPRQFAYTGNQLSAGIGWTLPFEIASELNYLYRHEIYDPTPSNARKDTEHHVILIARRPITEHISVSAGYFGQLNRTNSVQVINAVKQKLYEYDRHIGSVTFEVRF